MRSQLGMFSVYVLAFVVSACGDGSSTTFPSPDSSDGRGTITNGIDITSGYSRIYRSDPMGDWEYNEDELFLAQGNRAEFFLEVVNNSNGWVPINFELCVDHTDVLAVLDPLEYADQAVPLDGPCAVRFDEGAWERFERGDGVEFRVGSILALDRPGGGYVTVYLRSEFPDVGVLDLFEYTFPYRVLPSGRQGLEMARMLLAGAPRKSVLRRLVP